VVIPGNANKQTVAAAITARFKVTVEAVNIMNSKGKPKRTVRKGGRATQGSRSDSKKAYVTLKAGDKLPFFVEPDAPKKGKKSAVKKEG
jgi:large subunit ribosomal protein L23